MNIWGNGQQDKRGFGEMMGTMAMGIWGYAEHLGQMGTEQMAKEHSGQMGSKVNGDVGQIGSWGK